ncbi:MAG: tetratricopeptide repeat protein [Candidatus Melainabacteria bacterium]|nr:tetratricopeptide repeat protein [Candidatus Melainabacteria bacterium]
MIRIGLILIFLFLAVGFGIGLMLGLFGTMSMDSIKRTTEVEKTQARTTKDVKVETSSLGRTISSLMQRQEWEKAIPLLDEYAKLHPDDGDVVACQAFAHNGTNRSVQAVNLWTRAIDLAGDDFRKPTAFVGRGWAYMVLGETEKADADFRLAQYWTSRLYSHEPPPGMSEADSRYGIVRCPDGSTVSFFFPHRYFQ